MLRRWLIRLPFLLALTLVVGVWVTSYSAQLSLSRRINGLSSAVFASYGSFYGYHQSPAYLGPNLFLKPTLPDDPLHFSVISRMRSINYGPTTFGFRFGNVPALVGVVDTTIVIIPFWFPTLLSALLLYFVCRKTRLTMAGRAFPVEPTSAQGGPSA